MDLDETWNISEGSRCPPTQKWGNRPGVPPNGAKTCFVFLSHKQRGLSVTYPAPISTIFDTKDMISAQGVFQAPKTAKRSNREGVLVMGIQLKRYDFRRWESFRGLVKIPEMYVSFGRGRRVFAL